MEQGPQNDTSAKFLWGYQAEPMDFPVANVESAIPFYERMNFRLESRADNPASAILERDGIRIGIVENGRDPEEDGCAFEVGDVLAAHSEFRSSGLENEISGLKTENRGDGSSWKIFYIVSPDGLCYWIGDELDKSLE